MRFMCYFKGKVMEYCGHGGYLHYGHRNPDYIFSLFRITGSLLFAVLVFIYFGPSFTAEMYVAKATSFLSFFPLIIGVFVFLSVYADDFKCRSMQVAIGYGMPRGRIILAKLLESAR